MDPTLTHVRLLVDDYERCFRFYRDDLGYEPTFGDATGGYADFDNGDVTLALFDGGEMAASLDRADADGGPDRGRAPARSHELKPRWNTHVDRARTPERARSSDG